MFLATDVLLYSLFPVNLDYPTHTNILSCPFNDTSAAQINVWVRSIDEITLTTKNRNTLCKTYSSASLFTTNPRWTAVGSNAKSALRNLVINRLTSGVCGKIS